MHEKMEGMGPMHHSRGVQVRLVRDERCGSREAVELLG